MLLWVMGVEFENTCTISGKQNEDAGSVQVFIFCFRVWCKSRELGGRQEEGGSKIPLCNPSDKSFSSDFLRTMMNYWTESHLESCQTSTMELFYENSQRLKDVDYFRKKALPQIDWNRDAPPIGKVL